MADAERMRLNWTLEQALIANRCQAPVETQRLLYAALELVNGQRDTLPDLRLDPIPANAEIT